MLKSMLARTFARLLVLATGVLPMPSQAQVVLVDVTEQAGLDFGATAPAFRQQGSQSALMAARIAHAASLGCHTLMTCTGEDVPGDPQHSYSNILRAGFEPTYLRENFAPPKQADG